MRWMFFSEHEAFGGVESRCRTLARAFLRLGQRVDFACFEENIYGDLLQEYPELARVIPAPGDVRHGLDPTSLGRAWKFLRKQNADALFFCNAELPRFLPFTLMAPFAGIRRVVVHHGNEAYVPEPVKGRPYLGGLVHGPGLWRKKLLLRGRVGYAGVTHALFNNEDQQSQWLGYYRYLRARSRLWLPPLDLHRFSAARGLREQTRKELGLSGARVIGGVGRLVPQKGFDVLIRAFARISRDQPDLMLVLVGDGPEAGYLKQTARNEGVGGRVRFVGALKDVSPVMAALDVFVLSSITPNESLGIVIVEAMASGVPVVASDLPGARRLVDGGRHGVLVAPRNVESLAEGINGLLVEDERRARFIANGLRRARDCDAENVARDLLAWVGCCVAQRSLAPATSLIELAGCTMAEACP